MPWQKFFTNKKLLVNSLKKRIQINKAKKVFSQEKKGECHKYSKFRKCKGEKISGVYLQSMEMGRRHRKANRSTPETRGIKRNNSTHIGITKADEVEKFIKQ